MERTSTKHSARTDDAMQHETESLTRGAPVEARSEESRMAEPPGDGEFLASSVLHETSEPIMGMPLDEIAARSEFADRVAARRLPGGRSDVAAGRRRGRRARVGARNVAAGRSGAVVRERAAGVAGRGRPPRDADAPARRTGARAAVSEAPVRKPRSRARSAAPASEATAPASKARRADTPADVTSTVDTPPRDESYLGAVAEYARATWNLTQRTIRLAMWPIRRLRRH